MNRLAKFEITPLDGDFVLHLADEGGGGAAFIVTAEQLDSMIDVADELLDEDDAAFAFDDEDEGEAAPRTQS